VKKEARLLRSEYRRRFPQGDKLSRIASLINWNAFDPILEPSLFKNTGEGRPHIDVVLMMKVLVLQSWYGLADEMVETECKDRLTFQNFLGYPSSVPDSRTVWLFKERIAKAGKERELWDELQRQLDRYRVVVKKGQMKDAVLIELGGWRREGQHGPVAEVAPHTGFAQDSTIIEADSGLPTEEDVKKRKEIEEKKRKKKNESSSSSSSEGGGGGGGGTVIAAAAAAAAPSSSSSSPTTTTVTAAEVKTKERGEQANATRSRDGTWTKKRGRSYFGYKLHTKDDLSSVFINDFEVTTASVHDNNVDLTRKGEVCVRDRGYAGSAGRGLCINMIKATRGSPLTSVDKELNKFLAKVRAPVEQPFAVIKRIFHAGRVRVTTVVRVKVRMTFVCTCYNLFRALELASMKA
jgi:IS5 family transposase